MKMRNGMILVIPAIPVILIPVRESFHTDTKSVKFGIN
jgi:hypothetical protein